LGHGLVPHTVEPVQAKLQKIAPRHMMIEETSGQGQKIVVCDKDFRLLIHAHEELFQLELDANVQEVHCLVVSHEELLSSKCVLQQLESFGGDCVWVYLDDTIGLDPRDHRGVVKVFCGGQHIRKRNPNRLISSVEGGDGRNMFYLVQACRILYGICSPTIKAFMKALQV
jgi:hypothetical protein